MPDLGSMRSVETVGPRITVAAGRVAFAAAVLLLCSVGVFPFYWMFVTSIRPSTEIFEFPPRVLPSADSVFTPYLTLFEETGLAQWLWNSAAVSIATAFFACLFGAMAAYALSRFRFRGREASQVALLATQMFPAILLALPMFIFFAQLGLLDSLFGLSLAYLAFLIPVAAVLLKAFFDAIPVELEEASLIDGASRIQTLFHITLRLSLPGLASTFLFCFIISWDEFLFARIFIRQPDNWTVSLGLASFSGEFVTPWDQVMAAATIITLPAAVIFLALQRYLVRGLTAGGIKG
ncbi:MAG: carbohydrate ABC transporter permease [Rhodobacteraceae bacterium]|nr:carbohydrate ABC transporter permease [Paracoccaceae bacterium]MCY4137900.1 carbohydrate ABC transporter permease [Paracoccaceae bacterium]